MLDMVPWCQICQSRPSDGKLTVIPEGETEPEDWNVCELCVAGMPEEVWK